VASGAPTGNYGIDVHIDTGPLGSGWLSSAVQDVIMTPVWMGSVWAMHALLVMLEWSFTIDLLPSAAAGGLGRGLRQMEANFTQPWLPMVLAAASVLALYQGLIRRRVAETVGEAVLMAVMMLAGLWVISDPTGTVGALGAWASQAALGTLAVAAQGAPSHPERTFGSSLETVFVSAIEGPWCYLEFGDVGWCRETTRLDPRLRSAGLRIAATELEQIGCNTSAASSLPCVPLASESAKALQNSAKMLRLARSNGAIFLALPPNGPARNSINEEGSLLRTLCESSTATSCRGPAAGQAEFRTSAQTWSRLSGLLLIVAGLLGMVLLLGFLTLRLLAAALFSLLYLLLAPAVVLTPAFGEGGRALFRKWGLQLLGAVVSKLLFSFLLGVVLALVSIVADFTALGWWTQWLLMSAVWWGAYLRRHQALGLAGGVTGRERGAQLTVGRRVGGALETRARARFQRWVDGKREKKPAPDVQGRPPESPVGGRDKPAGKPDAAGTTPAQTTPASPEASSARTGGVIDKYAQLGRVHRAHAAAETAGDRRRAAELRARGRRIEEELRGEPTTSGGMEMTARDGRSAEDEQPLGMRSAGDAARVSSAHGRGSEPGTSKQARDYPRLAALAGYSRAEYERLDRGKRREARLAIDRELAIRKELDKGSHRPPREAQHADSSNVPEQSPRVELPRRGRESKSPVMRDAREVEAGRKRQLGPGRP
jgi:hypothetical protein